MESILKTIYPIPPIPPRHRTRPLDGICLGPARSGTDSLRAALLALGYTNVSHGFIWRFHCVNDSQHLYLLARKIFSGKPITRAELEQAFADFDALTDVPAIWFATDILRTYPEAKVVLNRRRDVHAWKRSFRESVLKKVGSWEYWWTSFFQAQLFWGVGLTNLMWLKYYLRGDFERNAVMAHDLHFEQIEKVLKEQGRGALRWSIEDGW
jgi:hypothetical protein